MKYAFFIALLLFVAAYAAALATLKPPSSPGETVLRWATDPNPARDRQSAGFAQQYPGLRVVTESGDATRLIVQCATGVGPDLMDIPETTMYSMAQAGLLVPLDDLAREHGFSLDKTYPSIRDALVVDGRQYRFPCNVNVQAVLYNKAIFDDHGVPYPQPDWTWDDFVTTAQAIASNPSRSGKKHIPVANWSPHDLLADLFVAHGARYFSEDGLTSQLDSPQAIAAFQQYHDLIFKYRVLPTPEQSAAMSSQGGWGSGGINWFSSGEAAMIIIGRWFTVQAANFPEIAGHLASVRLPRVPGQPSRGAARTRAAAINALSPHRDEAVKFLTYLASLEYGASIVRDGDSLPPNPALAKDGAALTNKAVPDAAFHQVFVDAIRDGRPLDSSPFVDPAQVSRWMMESIGKIENRVLTPEEAARQLAAEVNKTIQRNIEREPALRQRAASLREAHSKEENP